MRADDVVLQLGAVRPLVDPAEAADAAVRMGARAATLLRANRTVRLAVGRLGAVVDQDHAFGRELAIHRDRLDERIAMIDHSVELVQVVSRELGVPCWGIKGLAVRDLYARPTDRDVRDVDLWVAGVDGAGELARALLSRDFDHDANELPWIKRADGVTYGQIRIIPRDRRFAPVDIHFGPYSVGHRGRLQLTDASVRPGANLPVLTGAVNIRATLGNATGDCLVTTKDLNDYSLMADRLAAWEWDEHVRLAARVGSLRLLRTILHRLRHTQVVSPTVHERDAALAGRGILPARTPRLPDTGYRTRATVRRAAVQAHRTGEGSPIAAAVGAWRYYRSPLRLRVVAGGEAPEVTTASADRCVRLVPIECVSERPAPRPDDGVAGLVPVPTEHGELCRLAGRLYLPTVDYAISASLVGELDGRSAARAVPVEPDLRRQA